VAPAAWTTVQLTIHTDGSVDHELVGASTFPRHWLYDSQGHLVARSGLIDFDTWYRGAHGEATPWGGEDTPAVVASLETALERQLSLGIMRGGRKPAIRTFAPGEVLMRQGEPGASLVLVLDGIVVVDVDGDELAELGPGSILGERALTESGVRTATITARSRCKVAVADAASIEPEVLRRLGEGHHREDVRRSARPDVR
jgi:hypothetical protein